MGMVRFVKNMNLTTLITSDYLFRCCLMESSWQIIQWNGPKRIALLLFAFFFTIPVVAQPSYRVVILVDDSYPPYSYLKDGELVGLYVDVVRQAADLVSEKYIIELQPVPWKRGVDALRRGEDFALLPPYKNVQGRSFIWPYSEPLHEEVIQAFCNPNSSLLKIENTEYPLKPINVGINAGYLLFDQALNTALEQNKIKIWENKDTLSNILKLAKNRIDCYINDKWAILSGIKALKQSHPFVDLSQLQQDRIIFKRTAHIGYLKAPSEKFPFKDDFIKEMDAALKLVFERRTQIDSDGK